MSNYLTVKICSPKITTSKLLNSRLEQPTYAQAHITTNMSQQ